MNIRGWAIAGAAAVVIGTASISASAQDVSWHKGFYVSGGYGYNWVDDSSFDGASTGTEGDFESGWAALGALGYAFGDGLRVEGELGYRHGRGNDLTTGATVTPFNSELTSLSLMGNVVYDIYTDSPLTPYIGAGIGAAHVKLSPPLTAGDDSDTVFAYQGIAGLGFALNDNLELTLDYRYFATTNPKVGADEMENSNHSVLLGFRWRFGNPPAPAKEAAVTAPPQPPLPAPEPKPMAKPMPKPAPEMGPRSFLVFFDWNKSNIRSDAQQIIEAAAKAVREGNKVKIQLTGHADRSGPAAYNMRLSKRRADNVKAALVALGINGNDITVIAKGETEPLVPTADGVREPRNRRVEILF